MLKHSKILTCISKTKCFVFTQYLINIQMTFTYRYKHKDIYPDRFSYLKSTISQDETFDSLPLPPLKFFEYSILYIYISSWLYAP